MPPIIVRVFEHCRLATGDGGFEQAHFDQLVRYNERHGNRFFDVGHRRIRFKNYVGVIQVGNLIIEILPKADAAAEPDQEKWRNALLEMLRVCRLIRLDTLTNAHLRLRSASLADLYLETFLTEVEGLVRHGLVKRYRREEANLTALKGRLLFRQHVAHNLVHKERFYTRYVRYDRDNNVNQILKRALRVLETVAGPHLIAQARQLLESFDTVSDARITADNFDRIRFGRNTERYRSALQLAKLIILNYAPDLKGGRSSVLALLFDMNNLFEEYVFRKLRRALQSTPDTTASRQVARVFWQSKAGRKLLRPDIVVDRQSTDAMHRVILDTKWKVLRVPKPPDEDLRQMYAYHLQFEAERVVLLYPLVHELAATSGPYRTSSWIAIDKAQHCSLQFVDLFDPENRLRSDLGSSIAQGLFGGR